ncbi:LAFA_0E01244g1_1 [Lachancea sp. 'fantastica']|nr:LAFA_0E01244g1_1 [Lachancea sp. 'fantastica']
MSNNKEQPPSYDEAISSTDFPPATPQRPAFSAQTPPFHPPPPHQRPTSAPLRPPTAPVGQTSSSAVPWTYPRGYYCQKCGNTGIKVKTGRPCKRCWGRFAHSAPNSNVQVQYSSAYPSYYSYGPYSPLPQPIAPPSMSGSPLILQPGDPRIGGVLCGQCNGKGRVRFLLDKEICGVCRGTGRVF